MKHLRFGLPKYDMYDLVWGASSAIGNLVVPLANLQLGRDGAATSFEVLDYHEDLTMNTSPHSGDKRVGAFD